MPETGSTQFIKSNWIQKDYGDLFRALKHHRLRPRQHDALYALPKKNNSKTKSQPALKTPAPDPEQLRNRRLPHLVVYHANGDIQPFEQNDFAGKTVVLYHPWWQQASRLPCEKLPACSHSPN